MQADKTDARNDQPNVGDDKLLQQLRTVHVFTTEEWQLLPLSFRQQWWTETNYGRRAASPELIAIGRQHLEDRAGEST